MIESLAANLTLSAASLGHGDIIVVQRSPTCRDTFRHSLAPSYFLNLKSRLTVRFQLIASGSSKAPSTTLELTVLTTIGEARAALAAELGLPTVQRLRFLRHFGSPAALRPYDESESLQSLLARHDGTFTDTVAYELADGADTHKSLNVDWLETPSDPPAMLAFSVRHGQSIQEFLKELGMDVSVTAQPDPSYGRRLRLLQLSGGRVCKVVSKDDTVDSLDDNMWRYRAEPIPADQLHVGRGERIALVAHVRRDSAGSVTAFGEPLLLKLHEDEPLASVKLRVAALLGMDGSAEFASWRWGVVSQGRLQPIPSDAYAVLPRLVRHKTSLEGFEPYVAVEHEPVTRSKRTRPQNDHALRAVQSRQMRIYN